MLTYVLPHPLAGCIVVGYSPSRSVTIIVADPASPVSGLYPFSAADSSRPAVGLQSFPVAGPASPVAGLYPFSVAGPFLTGGLSTMAAVWLPLNSLPLLAAAVSRWECRELRMSFVPPQTARFSRHNSSRKKEIQEMNFRIQISEF